MRANTFPRYLFATCLGLLMSSQALAGYSRFHKSTLSVDIPCMEVTQSDTSIPSVYYQLSLGFNGSGFDVSSLLELDEAGECFAVYDQDSGVLTDQIWHKDKIFDVTLVTENGLSYALGSLGFRERSRSSLWRVSDGINELFIGGTIHVLNIDDFPLPDIFQEAFIQADILVTEISSEDLEGEDNAAAEELVINPDGLLSEILLPSTLEVVNDFLDQFGVTLDPVDNFRPFWAGLAMLQLKQSFLGYGPGVEAFFQDVAKLVGMTNLGLETSVSQVSILNSTSEEGSPDEIILSAIETAESQEYFDSLDFMIAAWRQGNTEFFAFLNNLQKAEDEESFNLILRDRNLAWIPQIEEMLTTEEVEIILVGVGHLAGDDNVLQLLEDLGYTVERYR